MPTNVSRRIALIVAAILLSGLVSCGENESGQSAPKTAPSTTGDSSEPSSPSGTATQEELRAAVRALVKADTGTFEVTPHAPDGADTANPLLATSGGSWSFSRNSGTSKSRQPNPDGGELAINQILVDGDAYAQVLFENSPWAPDCWSLSPNPGDGQGLRLPAAIAAVVDSRTQTIEGQSRNTLLVTDVLGAIGFQKAVGYLGSEAQRSRIPVTLGIKSGVLQGWEVNSSVLQPYFSAVAGAQRLDEQVFSKLLEDVTWHVTFASIGEPVQIGRPSRDKVIDVSRQTCAR